MIGHFGREVAGAVVALEGEDVGVEKEVEEGCVAVDGNDDGGARVVEAGGFNRVGCVQGG